MFVLFLFYMKITIRKGFFYINVVTEVPTSLGPGSDWLVISVQNTTLVFPPGKKKKK